MRPMTAIEMRELIATRLVRAEGGTRQQWRRAIGEIKVYAMETHPHCNWDARPTGEVSEVQAVNDAVDHIRMTRPHLQRS